jgi:hypothetical protein
MSEPSVDLKLHHEMKPQKTPEITCDSSLKKNSVFDSVLEEVKMLDEEKLFLAENYNNYGETSGIIQSEFVPALKLAENNSQAFAAIENTVGRFNEGGNIHSKSSGQPAQADVPLHFLNQTFDQISHFAVSFPQSWLAGAQLSFDRSGNDWRLKIKSSSAALTNKLSAHVDELSHQFSTHGLGQLMLSEKVVENVKKPIFIPRNDSS